MRSMLLTLGGIITILFSLLIAAYLSFASIQNAWISATPVAQPSSYKVSALVFLGLAIFILLLGISIGIILIRQASKRYSN